MTKLRASNIDRLGAKRNGHGGYRAYLRSSQAWCYLCQQAHSKAEHDALMGEKRGDAKT
jgi:hypothetical protein